MKYWEWMLENVTITKKEKKCKKKTLVLKHIHTKYWYMFTNIILVFDTSISAPSI